MRLKAELLKWNKLLRNEGIWLRMNSLGNLQTTYEINTSIESAKAKAYIMTI